MIRTYISNSYIKRTIRPLFAWTQATPKPCYLDPNWTRSVPIWPGMGFTRTGGDLVTLTGSTTAQMGSAETMVAAASQAVYGLGALYVGGDGIDELLYAGINAFAVWVLTPDSEFEILAPAFDTTQTWNDPPAAGIGTGSTLVYVSTAGSNQGMLIPAGASNLSANPVARLLKVNSSTKITIGGLEPYSATQLTAGTG